MAAQQNCKDLMTDQDQGVPDSAGINRETPSGLCRCCNRKDNHSHNNDEGISDSLIWLDKTAAIDHQYAVYADRHWLDGDRMPNDLKEHSQSCGMKTQLVDQQSTSGKTNQDFNTDTDIINLTMSHNSVSKVDYMAKASEGETDKNKPAYRMLVQRRSMFDGFDLNEGAEGFSDLQVNGAEDEFKCGHCSEIYIDRDALVRHLLTHNVSSTKQLAENVAHPSKTKYILKSKADADENSTHEDFTELSKSRRSSYLRGSNKVAVKRQRNTRAQMNAKFRNETHQDISGAKGSIDVLESSESSRAMEVIENEPKIHHTSPPTLCENVKQTPSDNNKVLKEGISRHAMSSVGKRNAKKNLGDDFIVFQPKRKKSSLSKITNPSAEAFTESNTEISAISASNKNAESAAKSSKEKAKMSEIKSCDTAHSAPSSLSKVVYQIKEKIKDTVDTPKIEISTSDTSVKHSDVTSKTILKCITCKGFFLWKWPFLNHLKVHPNERPYECLSCHKRLFSFCSYLSHVKHFHSPKMRFGCSKCDSSFRSKYLLKLHSKSHIEENVSMSSSDHCNKSSLHKHAPGKIKKREQAKGQENLIRCKPCGKIFQDRRNLWIHQKRHPNAIKPYRCHFCSRRFAMHKWLTDHIQRHTPVRNYPCGICGKRYFTKSDATMHERRHTKEATFACSECDRKFIYKSELNAHLKRHQGIKLPKNITCGVCKKSFATRRDLERHMTVHTGEKPFKCQVCGKSFSQEVNMQVHEKIHSGEKPYQCDLCEKKFIAKSKLKRHRQCHSTAKGMLDRPFKCVLCPRKYTAENSLIRHLRTHKNSPETITNITAALNKAAEESSATESSSTAGAVLACMIDQAISDAKHMARSKKKSGNVDDPSLAEIIDQAIHNSKASSSTQTPIVIENFNNTYVNIQLPNCSSAENTFASSSNKDKNIIVSTESSKEAPVSSCGDLIKLISDALIKHNETEHVSQSKFSSQDPNTAQTITCIVEPKTAVNNSSEQDSNKLTSQQIIGLSTPQMPQFSSYSTIAESRITNQSTPALPSHQSSSLTDNIQQIPALPSHQSLPLTDSIQQIYVHTLNFPEEDTNSQSQEEITVSSISEPTTAEAVQYVTVSEATSEPFVLQSLLQSVDNTDQQHVLPMVIGDNMDLAPSPNSQLVNTATTTSGPSSDQQQVMAAQNSVSLITTSSTKNELGGTTMQLENPRHPNKMRHIIVKTSGGQTFLIPSALISLNESSPLLMTTLPTTSTESENAANFLC